MEVIRCLSIAFKISDKYSEITKPGDDPACSQMHKLRLRNVTFQTVGNTFYFFINYYINQDFEDRYIFNLNGVSFLGEYVPGFGIAKANLNVLGID